MSEQRVMSGKEAQSLALTYSVVTRGLFTQEFGQGDR